MAKKTKAKAVNPTEDTPTMLLIRNVPPEIFTGLDEWIAELERNSDAQAKYSRTGLALKAIKDTLASRKKEGTQ